MVSHAQLRALELSARSIGRAVERRRLHPVHRGVYSLVPAGARPALAAEQAALLACGSAAVLSHASAARLHGLRVPVPPQVFVSLVAGDRRVAGVTVHRIRALSRAERWRVAGLATTSVARTILDLAPGCPPELLAELIDQALRMTSRTKLREATERHAGRPGVAVVAGLLDPARPSAEAWSEAERRLLALVRRARLTPPEANVSLGPYTPDLMWRAERVIVEFDSWAFHGGRAAFGRDRDRGNQLVADGWQIIRVTWEQLTERPEQVLVWIAAALARGSGGPAAHRA